MDVRDRNRARRRRATLLTARDRLLLEMAAEHRLILPAHAAARLGVSPAGAAARLRALSAGGYMTSQRLFAGQPSCHQISRRGLEVIGSALRPPRIDLRSYAHDVGLAWLWLAAHAGTFGAVQEILSERTMRSRDARRQSGGQLIGEFDRSDARANDRVLGVRVGGRGPSGRERLHYPDLLFITPQGHRLAVELELSAKARGRLDRILAGYGADPGIDAVLYLVDRPALARTIQTSARRLGIAPHVHVQRIRRLGAAGLADGSGAVRDRPPGRSAPALGRQP